MVRTDVMVCGVLVAVLGEWGLGDLSVVSTAIWHAPQKGSPWAITSMQGCADLLSVRWSSHACRLHDKLELLLVRVAVRDCAKAPTVHTLIDGHQVCQEGDGVDKPKWTGSGKWSHRSRSSRKCSVH